MSLQCGIVGLPNVGKSTLFNSLSNARAQAANFPFCTIEPNMGVISVPDARLSHLAELVHPERIVTNTIEIVDIAGLVKGASKGEGLGNQFLGNIRNTDAIIHVLRCFVDDNIIHVDGSVNPIRDKEIIDIELQLKDLEAVEKKIQKTEKIAKISNDKEVKKNYELLLALKSHLLKGESARDLLLTEEEKVSVEELNLISLKPVIYVCNVSEKEILTGNFWTKQIQELGKKEKAQVLLISAEMEAEISTLDSMEERQLFLEEYGLSEPSVNKLIKSCYYLLNLLTYFTAGVQEVRAWTIRKGMTAPQAAGVIHTDFEKGFIRAEVIRYDDFINLKSEAACKDAGKLHVEGKTYIVEDGDIMHFRFNI